METEEIISELKYDEIIDNVFLFKKENMHLPFDKCFDKALHSFKVRWAWKKKKFLKDKESLSLNEKVAIERADSQIKSNINFIRINRFEIQDQYNLKFHPDDKN